MKLKPAIKYYLKDTRIPVLCYYGIVLVLYIFISIVSVTFENNGSASSIFSNFISTYIFILIVCLNSFKPQFLFFLQNGVSRKTGLIAFLCSGTIYSAILAVADTLLLSVSNFKWFLGNIAQEGGNFIFELLIIIFRHFGVYLFFIILGYFISLAYYRMNKITKIAVSVGIPVVFINLVAYIDNKLSNNIVFQFLYSQFDIWAYGLYSGNEMILPSLYNIVFAVVITGLIYLLLRKVEIKKTI